jgi:hypothetical protein
LKKAFAASVDAADASLSGFETQWVCSTEVVADASNAGG